MKKWRIPGKAKEGETEKERERERENRSSFFMWEEIVFSLSTRGPAAQGRAEEGASGYLAESSTTSGKTLKIV